MLPKTRLKSLTARLPSRMNYLEFSVLGHWSSIHRAALSRYPGWFQEFNLFRITVVILDNVRKFKLVGICVKAFFCSEYH